jgi:hypothetical protein
MVPGRQTRLHRGRLAAGGVRRPRRFRARSWRRESALKFALPSGQTLQRRGHGIEAALEAVHAVVKRLRIKVPLGFELADAVAGTPPCDAEANGTDPEALSRDEQRAQKKARRIHVVVPLLGVWQRNAPRISCKRLARSCTNLRSTALRE